MNIKLNPSYYASSMLDAFKDVYYAQNYAGIIGLGLSTDQWKWRKQDLAT